MDPDPSNWLLALGIVLCLAVLAFTSAVDASLTAINRRRLGDLLNDGSRRASTIKRLLDDPYYLKSSVIVLNTSATIAAGAFVLRLTRPLGEAAIVVTLAALVLAALVVSEVLPKALVLRNPDRAALLLSRPMDMVTRLLYPLVALVSLICRPLVRLVSGRAITRTPLVTEEELLLLVNVGEEEGLIEKGEREMIESVFGLGDTLVRELMVPRIDIIALDATTPLREALNTIMSTGHSRIPIYRESSDDIVGLLYAKDMLPALAEGNLALPVASLMRKPYYVPETMKVDALLKDLQRLRVHLAIAVDEYGATAGLVTIEDLIEEIVGEIQDEYDREEPAIRVVGDHVLEVDARALIDEINAMTGLAIESEDADRIGGFVYEQLGSIPEVGDLVELENAAIEVLAVSGVRPTRLRLTYRAPDHPDGDAAEETTGGGRGRVPGERGREPVALSMHDEVANERAR
jgi:putative hemolysin